MKYLIFVLSLAPFGLLNAQFVDLFTDGDFTQSPTWIGNTDSFEIIQNVLHLNAPSNTAESYLSTASQGVVSGIWEFFVRFDFNPSSSNKALVYIMSDESNLSQANQGYVIMLGNSSDEISLYQLLNGNMTKIIDGQDGLLNHNQNELYIKLERSEIGLFTLWADTALNQNYFLIGQTLNQSCFQSAYFGVLCDYTASRSDKFWFDNFTVTTSIYMDSFPPKIDTSYHYQLSQLHVICNEGVDSVNLNVSSINNQNVSSFTITNHELILPALLDTGLNTIHLVLYDSLNNELDTNYSFYITPSLDYASILINEIYADETPSYGMPDNEFLELYNPGLDTQFLNGCFLADASDTIPLPYFELMPDSLIILCKTTAVNDYSAFGNAIGVPNFISLNNTEDQLSLLNAYYQIIDSVSYSSTWYNNEVDSFGNEKNNGGFSLERINIKGPCSSINYWFPSKMPEGASPGKTNSVTIQNTTSSSLKVLDYQIENDSTLHLYFNTAVFIDSNTLFSLDYLDIEQFFTFDQQHFTFLFSNPIQTNIFHMIDIQNLIDCYGQYYPTLIDSFIYLNNAEKGDLLINEILFNPKPNGSDYLEIYNNSSKIISTEGFQIQKRDVDNPLNLVDEITLPNKLIKPNDYWVFTNDSFSVSSNYYVENPRQLVPISIPNFNDDEGIIVLVDDDLNIVDSMYYHKNWHSPFIDNVEGVSLERTNATTLFNVEDNWHSAAKTYGYGTPTAQNSQFFEYGLGENIIIAPAVISPDGDGFQDYLIIQFNNTSPQSYLGISIYDLQGRQVKELMQKELIGQHNQWQWDGSDKFGNKVPIGIYILVFEHLELNGKTRQVRKSIVVAAKL